MEENKTATAAREDVILPDGWDENKDFFAQYEETDSAFADEQKAETEPGTETAADGPVHDEPTTTGEEDTKPQSPADEETPDLEPDGAKEESAESSRVLKLRVNHQDKELDINAMSDEDLTALMQKAYAYDAKIEAERKQKYRDVFNRLKGDGYPDEIAAVTAQNAAGGHVYPLEDTPETVKQEPIPEPVKEETKLKSNDFTAELQQVKALFPDLKTMPKEVMDAYGKGASLLNAYAAYRVSRGNAETVRTQRENKILKQNAKAAAKAPVKGATGGGETAKPTNAFEEAFLKGFDKKW